MNLYFPTDWALLHAEALTSFLSAAAAADLIMPIDVRDTHKRASFAHGLSVVDHHAYAYLVGVAEVWAGIPTGSPAWVYITPRNPYTLRGGK